MSRRHLVTGAAGLVGYELVRGLLAAGESVVAADRRASPEPDELAELGRAHPGRLEVVTADLAQAGGRALPAEPFAVIHHAAALLGVGFVEQHPYETLAVNVRSTLNVLDHAQEWGCDTFLLASSSEAYAFGVAPGWVPLPTPAEVPVGVADVELPRWSYAASKIAGESALFGAARAAGFRPVVARLHNVYGPRMRPTHVVPALLQRCRAREDPFAVYGAEQTRSFLHVQDAARALLLLAATPAARGVFHVGSDRETRIAELAQLALRIAGHDPEILEREAPPGSVERRVPDIAPLRALGFEPRVALEEGVAECWAAISTDGGG